MGDVDRDQEHDVGRGKPKTRRNSADSDRRWLSKLRSSYVEYLSAIFCPSGAPQFSAGVTSSLDSVDFLSNPTRGETLNSQLSACELDHALCKRDAAWISRGYFDRGKRLIGG